MAVSRAQASWQGDLVGGSGSVEAASGAFSGLGLTWAARTERPSPGTSPEELIAAAHAGCYAMALSHALAEDGHPAQWLDVSSEVHFTPKQGGGFEISRCQLAVVGSVAGLDGDRFRELAEQGEAGCPVSGALRGSVEIALDARLA